MKLNKVDNKTNPELNFYLNYMSKDDGMYSFVGCCFFEGRKQGVVELKTDFDLFKKERKPKPRSRMLAYVLAYYLALYLEKSKSNQAALQAAAWLKIEDEKSIHKAVRDYPIPKNAVALICENPLGVIFMLEPQKIIRNFQKLSYSGWMYFWKVGDREVSIARGKLGDIDFDILPSPLKILSDKKTNRKQSIE